MTSVARKLQSGVSQKDVLSQGRLAGLKPSADITKEKHTRQSDCRRKDLNNSDRGDRLYPPNGAAHGASPPALARGGNRGTDYKDASETRPRVLDDVDMSEVKVQEDQLLGDAGEFVCKICQIYVVGRTPKLTQCSHLFCGDCLAQWFSRQPLSDSRHPSEKPVSRGQARAAPCPVCKSPLDEFKHISAVNSSSQAVLSRMLASTKIVCANNAKVRSDGTCDWTGCYSDYQKHIASCGHCLAASIPQSAPDPPTKETAIEPSPPAPLPGGGGLPQAAALAASRELQAALGIGLANTDSNSPTLAPPPPAKGAPPMLATVAPVQSLAHPPLPMSIAVTAPWAMHQNCEVPNARGGSWEPAFTAISGLEVDGVPANVGAPAPFAGVTTNRGSPQSWQPQLLGTGPPNQVPPVAFPMGSGNVCHSSTSCGGIRATSEFDPAGPDMVQVHVGDYIQVLENLPSGWAYCHNTTTLNTGWAPSWVVTEEEFAASPEFSHVQSFPVGSRHADQAQLPWQMAFEPPRPNFAGNMLASCPVTEAVQGHKTYEVKEVKVSFAGVGPSQLSLAPGELVEVFDRDTSGWTYGRKVLRATSPCMPSIEGWFPDWACGLGASRPPAAPWGAAWS